MTPMPKHVVVFGIPTLSKSISIETHMSMMAVQWTMFTKGYPLTQLIVGGDPYLSKVRNKIVHIFLHSHTAATDLFFVDDDVGFPDDAALRLIESDKDVIAGIYPRKEDGAEWPAEIQLDIETRQLLRDGELCMAGFVPTGFLRIKRWVLEKMAANSEWYWDKNIDGSEIQVRNVFDMGVNYMDRKWWGEDYLFCQKWRNMGGDVWIDPNIDFSHRGSNAWKGNFSVAVSFYNQQLATKMAAE